ncbi:hypothetical protein ACFL4O_03735, partial [bacterium]
WNQADNQFIGTDEVRARDSGGLSVRDDAGGLGIHIKDGGKVGVGTIDPNGQFSLAGSFLSQAYSDHSRILLNNDTGYGIGAGQISASANDKDLYIWSNKDTINKDADIRFMSTTNGNTNPSGWQTNMVIKGDSGNVGIGTTSPEKELDITGEVRSTVSGVEFYMVPKGGIILWSGSIESIPAGWALCNGSNGTPDLRDRFIVGAGSSYSPDNTGGANSVTLSVNQLPAHSHSGSTSSAGAHSHSVTISATRAWEPGSQPYKIGYRDTVGVQDFSFGTSTAGSHTHSFSTSNTGSGSAHENRPPYYALAYIMKL